MPVSPATLLLATSRGRWIYMANLTPQYKDKPQTTILIDLTLLDLADYALSTA
jgi:hypothetical protein